MNYPIKVTWKSELLSGVLLVSSLVLGFYFYSRFPDQVVTHWNFEGQPDDYSSRFWGAFMGPIILFGSYTLLLLLPVLDPKRDRYREFEKAYAILRNMIVAALFVIFMVTGVYNLGYNVSINVIVPIVIGGLFIVLGNYMGKIKSNWFVGIRTPWTLSNEDVWNKTHRFGGRLMMLFGLIVIVSPILSRTWGITLFAAGIAAVVLGSVVYSYLLYKRILNGKRSNKE